MTEMRALPSEAPDVLREEEGGWEDGERTEATDKIYFVKRQPWILILGPFD